ncbi:hypothetical protein XM38_020720 [Halomicronema hongdechloris C2206]|uniref:DUF3153 domain-containing protein n=1 Tax=Halomicronema hongdechloris C2206 TaxID=1641165 RepID=A0A1Z3HLC6_9CYAN|nr:DUF3153 domain-containing protein [Halomicronema hongdechloris]ASC71122.1 hypothetical protein XM38_020720 [Halomicronema hongdechloris C2206]
MSRAGKPTVLPKLRGGRRWPLLLQIIGLGTLLLLLSGCVRYDVSIQFDRQTRGQIVQHVHLTQRAAAVAADEVALWRQQLQARAQALGGRVRSPSTADMDIVLPFHNGAELTRVFNQFFQPEADWQAVGLPQVATMQAQLSLQQGNWLVAIRNHFVVEVDLRDVPELSPLPETWMSRPWLDLRFAWQTPWGLTVRETTTVPPLSKQDGVAQWRLRPGQVNYLEGIVWVPSWVGIGTLAIATLVALGWGIKYRLRN